MFKIPDEIMAMQEETIEDKETKVLRNIRHLEAYFKKYEIKKYVNYETIPEWEKYLRLKSLLEELREIL